jgi:hypothetical protein
MTRVSVDSVVRGPELPEDYAWHPRTVAWWQTWRESPMAQAFTAADWDFLLDTARLHSELWAGQLGVAAELRLRVSKFGASPEDRLRLKLKIDEDAQEAVEPEQSLSADRKARLRAVVND